MKNSLLTNKNAVVFGAGGNLGKQVAKAFVDQGANVYVSDIDPELLAEIINVKGSQKVDALNESEVEKYLTSISKTCNIDIVINLSTSPPSDYNHGKPASEVSLDQFLIPMRTTTGTQFVTAKAAYKHMSQKKSGVIIFISSTLSKIAPPWTTALVSSHAATEALTMTLANEWGPEGIRVIGVRSEAMTESPTIEYTFKTMGANIGLSKAEMQNSVEQRVPLRRLTHAGETAQVIVFAASDLAGFMTGTMINHSGGHVLE